MKTIIYLITVLVLMTSCNRAKDKAKDVIKGSGEIVGKSVSEFGKGITEGVEETFELKIETSEELKSNGIELGKIEFNSDSIGTDNLLSVYLIFNQPFNKSIQVKVFDHNNLEMGRSSITINADSGEANYYDFQFDKRTNIDTDSKIIME